MNRSGIVAAWAAGLGIVTWHSLAKSHRPPMPGQYLGVSGLFVLLAVLADYPPATGVATALAIGVDIAALLQVLPGTGAPAAQAPGQPQTGTKPKA